MGQHRVTKSGRRAKLQEKGKMKGAVIAIAVFCLISHCHANAAMEEYQYLYRYQNQQQHNQQQQNQPQHNQQQQNQPQHNQQQQNQPQHNQQQQNQPQQFQQQQNQNSLEAIHQSFQGAVVPPDAIAQHMGNFLQQQAKQFTMDDALQCSQTTNMEEQQFLKDECQQCVLDAAKCVMQYSMKKWEEFCSKAQSDFWQRICKASEEDKEVTLGMLIQKIHPIHLGWAYCLGKQSCKSSQTSLMTVKTSIHQKMEQEQHMQQSSNQNAFTMADLAMVKVDSQVEKLTPDTETMTESMMGSRGMHPLMGTTGKFGTTPNQMEQCQQPQECGATSDGSIDKYCCNKIHECQCCTHMGAQYVMHRVVNIVKNVCEQTQSPNMKAACDAAKQHKKIAYGYLLGKVEPWKYSFGACAATSTCDIPSFCHYNSNKKVLEIYEEA